ncbi:hypothetical protein ASPWEDRAFT_48773 [Aspergillus wentii DTO 134E9]|uniref:Zn(2)-C6 fungal-type domain-containing protein n=1 Tax=Aspergillus wentii DTO 134E9 TaxID=1073089 RepID=A0A1L9RUM9_ASPWE|nr:uncharacterized protein ASPWEDRAFT_48773 [Aspergillus wentii DTO 134E9]KAI9928494.1 Maltose acetyltransferase [Aspergillus wentii]OJJ38567.1 hypothetical protein ASPWEDRAFT_48773 [Aspergillus wentii DTO 134E9]
MAAVASTAVMNGGHDSEREPNADHSPSRFTAVNGREPLAPAPVSNGTSNNEEPREASENWGRSGHDTPSRQDERLREGGNAGNDQEDRRSQRSSSHTGPSTANRNKRKRSESDGRQETPQTSYQASSLPRSPASRLDDGVDLHPQPTTDGSMGPHGENHHKNLSPPIQVRPENNEGSRTPSVNGPWHEYDSQLISQAQRAQQIDASDAQLAEVLQREAQGHETAQKNWGAVNRPVEGPMQNDHSPSLTNYPPERPQATVQVAPKRKRVFSNRTKTGCMTCRKRKKKCDEQHPACNNCIRGGFLCEGYSSRSTWQKPSSAKTPVPLQSKEGYPEIGGQYLHELSQQHDRPQNLTEQLEAGKIRPIIVDDSDRAASQYSTSPTGVGSSRGSWPKRTWPGTGHPGYISEHMPKSDYREVPPIHEFSREGHPKADYHVVPSIRELSHGTHPKPTMPLLQGGIDQRPASTSNMDTSSPQAQARMALSIEHQLSARTVTGEETEKEKMIRGELYRPYDIQLVEERDRCKAALWRFNSSCNPISGLSAKEQGRLLKEIVIPPNTIVGSHTIVGSPSGVSSRSTGSIGQGAIVEAPFHCHYGYNIHIGEDVLISENCLFVDDCAISIGAHTWIGPRVTILSSMAHANMQERKGSQSRYQGRPVTIEEDCYVGSGCTIYPGVRLRRGAYVAPGEVVKSDIVAYGFQGLKPSYM